MTIKTRKINKIFSRNTNKINSKLNNNKTKKSRIPTNLLIGCHASITPSILDGIQYVSKIGGNAVQIFLGSNRSASMKAKTKITPEDVDMIRKYCQESKMVLIIHSIYLLNFCKYPPNSGRIAYAHENLQHDLKWGAELGAKCVVLHLGFKNELTMEEALENLAANINKILREMPKGIMLSLETSAGQGSQFGYSLEALELLWNKIKHNNKDSKGGKGGKGIRRVGFCIDTAHIFVSGYDISTVAGIRDYLEKFNRMIGTANIINFHINDSRFAMGSRKDEHRGIGQGLIYNDDAGKKALKYIKKFCMAHKIPMILETHGAGSSHERGTHEGVHGYEAEIRLIKGL